MKNLILLNRSGMSPEVTCRKGRHAIESIVSRFSLVSLICVLMLTLGVGNAWGEMHIEYYTSGDAYSGDDIDLYLEITGSYITNYDEPITLTLKNSSPGWTLNNGSCWMDITLSGSEVPTYVAFADDDGSKYGGSMSYTWYNQYGQQALKLYFYFDAAGDYSETLTISQKNYAYGTEQQSGTFTINFHVTKACTEPTVAFANTTYYYDKDASDFTKTATAKVGGSSTGQTITYSSSNTSVATVNSSTGKVSLKGVVGTTVITATAASNATYCEGTGSYTLYVYTAPTVNTTHFAGDGRTPTSATFKGCQVSDKGGLAILNYGWVVGTSSSVDWDDKTTYAGHSGDISLNTDFGSATTVGALTPGTTYYIRGFAYNGKAFGYTTYGTFTTPYAITLDKNGGLADGSAYVLPNGTSLSNISAPTRTGYTVEGYYTTSGVSTKIATDEGALQASITVSSTGWTNGSSQWIRGAGETFYAKWSPKSCSITFDKNSGTGGSDGTTATYGQAMTTITPPTRVGYTFGGYYDSETSNNGTGTKYYNADGTSARNWDKDVTATQTLYANWSVNTYTVQWKVNGVLYTTGTPSSSVNHGEHVSTLPTAPNPATYCSGADVFVGWTTAADGTYVHGTSPLFTTAAGAPTATGDQVFHAVFADYDD